jgi:hypothetical protein
MKKRFIFLIMMSSLVGSQYIQAMTEPPKKRVVFLCGQKALYDDAQQKEHKSAFTPIKSKSPIFAKSFKPSTAPLSPSLIPLRKLQSAIIEASLPTFSLDASGQLLRENMSGSGDNCADSTSGATASSSSDSEFGSPKANVKK